MTVRVWTCLLPLDKRIKTSCVRAPLFRFFSLPPSPVPHLRSLFHSLGVSLSPLTVVQIESLTVTIGPSTSAASSDGAVGTGRRLGHNVHGGAFVANAVDGRAPGVWGVLLDHVEPTALLNTGAVSMTVCTAILR
jgi:hypothetical protein